MRQSTVLASWSNPIRENWYAWAFLVTPVKPLPEAVLTALLLHAAHVVEYNLLHLGVRLRVVVCRRVSSGTVHRSSREGQTQRRRDPRISHQEVKALDPIPNAQDGREVVRGAELSCLRSRAASGWLET